MRDRTAVAIIIAIWLLSTILWLQPGIMRPDGVGYYVYLPSAYIGHDLLFFDEWQRFGLVPGGRILHKEITPTDHLGDHWTCGSAVWWLPSFILGDALRLLLHQFPRDGISLPYNVPVVIASAVAGLGVLLIGWWMSRSLLAVLGIWFGSPLLWYSLRNSISSHAVSAFACALFVFLAVRLRNRTEWQAFFGIGLAAGFAAAVRPQNLSLAVIPFFFSFRKSWIYLAGILAALLPELIVSQFIYGNPIAFFFGGTARPFAAFERIWIWEPLFSWYHGLFTWTPFLALGVVGFAFLIRDDRRLGLAAVYAFASQWIINASFERSFWGAYSFGQRRFDNCLLFFLLGAAALFRRIPRWLAVALTVVSAGWTMSLYFAALDGLNLSSYYTPTELFRLAEFKVPQPFGSVPVAMRVLVFAIVLVCLAAWIIAYVVLRRFAMIAAASVVSIASILFLTAGLNDRSHLPRFRSLIDHNRPYQLLPGGPDVRFGLLSDEATYLRKSGRIAEAEKTERELIELQRARRAAAARMGIQE